MSFCTNLSTVFAHTMNFKGCDFVLDTIDTHCKDEKKVFVCVSQNKMNK